MTLDETDIRILRELQLNSRLSNKELSARIHLSTTPTFERHRRLERSGIIQGYTTIINAEQINRGFTVFCQVGFKQINQTYADKFRNEVQLWPEVSECYNISGDSDFLMKVCVRGMAEYQEFLLNKVGVLDYVGTIKSIFVMGTFKHEFGVIL